MSNEFGADFELEVEDGVSADAPERIAIFGEGAVGKSVWAAGAPRPFFVDVERSSRKIPDVARNRRPIETWQQLRAAVAWLAAARHPYQTAVLDTLDRAEWLCWAYLREEYKAKSLEDIGGGYGKGALAALEQMRLLFASLERLCERRDMHVIVVAHQRSETIKNPMGADYQRYNFKVDAKLAGLIHEACDHVFFARRDVQVAERTFEPTK